MVVSTCGLGLRNCFIRDKLEFIVRSVYIVEDSISSASTRASRCLLLNFRRRRAVEYLTLGTSQKIQHEGLDHQRAALALDLAHPVDTNKLILKKRGLAEPRLVYIQ